MQADQKRIGPDAAKAMIRLEYDQDFQAYQRYLKDFLDRTRRFGDTAIGHEKEWNQGWCQCLQFLVDLPAAVRCGNTPPK